MSMTKSVQFYCGKRCVEKLSFFGNKYLDYEFIKDIAYKDITFHEVADELRSYMVKHDIKIGYCDISCDFGGGYSLLKRYVFVNKSGTYVTRKESYAY